ncbi:unnamed protein product [Lactuca virosa]|uniref:Uncharacterized protein n=1 Tax=Lactuca virosa TaxID=75947 RepID=A0AAU9MQX4_9ASTR|nr:unnamed protein product [Lactuca virosa]
MVFSVHVKEVPDWTPSFNFRFSKVGNDESDVHGYCEDDGSYHSLQDKDEYSSEPFGIYNTVQKMKQDEAKTKGNIGFSGWGSGKGHKNRKRGCLEVIFMLKEWSNNPKQQLLNLPLFHQKSLRLQQLFQLLLCLRHLLT